MQPQQPHWGQPHPGHVIAPPPPGHHHAAPWGPPPAAPPRPTWLGRAGLACSIGALGLPLLSAFVAALDLGVLFPLRAVLIVLSPVSAVLGIVFSAMGLSRRYTGRGLAIAGLVVGIGVNVLALAILVTVLAG